jgi:glutaredoxin-like protein
MGILEDKDKEQVKEQLADLTGRVQLVMFTQAMECDFCEETRELVEEIAALSDKVEAIIYDFVTDQEKAEEYAIDKIPAIAVLGEKDYGVRFYGMPGGYEFVSLLEAIKAVSSGQSGLSQATEEALDRIEEPVHLQVFITPT